MAIAVIQDFDGATLGQYDRIIDRLGITPGADHSGPGCLFHWVTATDTGMNAGHRRGRRSGAQANGESDVAGR